MIKFTVPGHPIPAVRMTQGTKYTNPRAKEYLAYKRDIGYCYRTATREYFGKDKLCVIMAFYSKSPLNCDIDNLTKSVLDGLNMVAWDDDRNVLKIMADKYRCPEENEHVEVIIMTIEEANSLFNRVLEAVS